MCTSLSQRAIRAAGIIAALLLAVAAHAQSDAKKPDATRSEKQPFVNPETSVMELYVGPWAVVEKHYDPDGKVVATVNGTEEIAWIVDRRAVRRSYITTSPSNVYRAFGVLSWDDVEKAYRGVWLDNASTNGPSTVTGRWEPDTQTMIFNVESRGEDGSSLTYKIVDHFADPEHHEATTYRLQDSQVTKLLEVQYKRTIPCPAKLRVILDGIQD